MCTSLVSRAWALSTGNTKHLDSILDDPAHYTILSLPIPNTDIDPQYWGYLADDEAEDDINATRHPASVRRDGEVELAS
jgi:hypothetical protein